MGLRNSAPHCYNQVRLDTRLFGVVSVTNSVSMYLKDFVCWCVRVLKPVVELEVGAEGGPLLV